MNASLPDHLGRPRSRRFLSAALAAALASGFLAACAGAPAAVSAPEAEPVVAGVDAPTAADARAKALVKGERPSSEQKTASPPARAPAVAKGQAAAADLKGSVWAGTDSDGDYYTFYYLASGVLRYTSPSGTYDNGTWVQDGAKVEMEMNDRYAVYTGIIAGDRITGAASNVAGKSWTWDVQKQRK
jgi:hypothetical protein